MAGLDVWLCSIVVTMLGPKNKAGCFDLLERQTYSTKLRSIKNLANHLVEQQPSVVAQAELVLAAVKKAEALGEKRNLLAHAFVQAYNVPSPILFSLRPSKRTLLESMTVETLERDVVEVRLLHEDFMLTVFELLKAADMLPPWMVENMRNVAAHTAIPADAEGSDHPIRETTAPIPGPRTQTPSGQ